MFWFCFVVLHRGFIVGPRYSRERGGGGVPHLLFPPPPSLVREFGEQQPLFSVLLPLSALFGRVCSSGRTPGCNWLRLARACVCLCHAMKGVLGRFGGLGHGNECHLRPSAQGVLRTCSQSGWRGRKVVGPLFGGASEWRGTTSALPCDLGCLRTGFTAWARQQQQHDLAAAHFAARSTSAVCARLS